VTENRLIDYLDHMAQAASEACDFVDGFAKEDFIADKRTQQAVIMNLISGSQCSQPFQGYSINCLQFAKQLRKLAPDVDRQKVLLKFMMCKDIK
jgi:hypothetical protein